MISLLFYLGQQQGFFGTVYARIEEGGPFQMTLILLLFILMLILVVITALKLKKSGLQFSKHLSLINQVGLLALVIGLFGQLIGLIQVFDAFESLGNINPAVFAGGIKLTLLPPVFGGFTFLLARIAILVLSWIRNEERDKMKLST